MRIITHAARDTSQLPHHDSLFRAPILLLGLLTVAYALYFANLTLTRYAAFESRALDMGNMHQAIWNTADGNFFHLTNQPGTLNRLSLHVEPILIPISWLYWIYSGPETLLVLQAVIVALGAIPTFRLAQREFAHIGPGGDWLALLFALTFLLNPSMQAANWLEFHPVTLAPTFILAAFYCLRADSPGWFAFFAVLTASCKEEMALLVLMMGLYAFMVLRRPRWGLITMALALGWAFLAVFVIQNLFAAGNIHWGRYGYLGDSPSQMVWTLFTQPDIILDQLRKADALLYLVRMLLPVAFLALLSPEILVLALPSLGINLLADFAPMHQVSQLIYAAPIVPFVTAAGIVGLQRLLSHFRTAYDPHRAITISLGLAVLFCTFFNQIVYGYLPGSGNYRAFVVSEHDRRAAHIIEQIPPDAKVSAQDKLNPHVSGRKTIYIFPRIDDADTVFLDVTGPAWPQHPNDVRNVVDKLLAQDFGVAAAEDGYLLLATWATSRVIPDSFYSAWRLPAHARENGATQGWGDVITLVDHEVGTDEHGELITRLYWRAISDLDSDFRLFIAYQDGAGNTLYDSQFYPPVATLWYPTSQWRTDETVLVQTLPWTLDVEQFALVIGVYQGEEWQTGVPLAPTTGPTASMPHLANGLVRLGGYERKRDGEWVSVVPSSSEPERITRASFGEGQAMLEGITQHERPAGPGEAFTFTLHWSAGREPIVFDYALFAHVLNRDNVKVAQLDWQPRDEVGPRPMTTWIEGVRLNDTQSLTLPTDLPSGSYRVILGVYNWQSGERLPALGADVLPGDVVEIGQVTIK